MANKTRAWSTEELQGFGLVDCTARPLPLKEIVAVRCASCQKTGMVRFSNLRSKMITYGLRWRCGGCLAEENSQRGKRLTGKKNPFYGKHHTKENREAISRANRDKWARHSPEHIREMMCNVRAIAYEKYGGNPMCDKHVRAAHLEAIKAFFSDAARVHERNRLIAATTQKHYGVDFYVMTEEAKDSIKKNTSRGELEVRAFFESQGVVVHKARKDGVEIDVLAPSLNLGVEFNGCYNHSEKFKNKRYHLAKTEYCEHHGIRLIHIFDHEWHTRKLQIAQYLMSIIGKNKTIYARSCKISEIDKVRANCFLEDNHIQGGSGRSKLFLGLELDGELLCVGAFGIHHRNNKDWVMQRFASKGGITVTGGLSRISKSALSILKTDIVSWCDRRWSDGIGYKAAGWTPEKVLPPSYFYIKNGRFYCSKQARSKKAAKTPEGVTEREHAKLDKLLRVYDCGKIRFVLKFKTESSGQDNGGGL